MYTVYIKYASEDYNENFNYFELNGSNVIERVIRYAHNPYNPNKNTGGCRGVFGSARDCAMGFYTTQVLFNKTNGKKLSHLIISFAEKLRLSKGEVIILADIVADYIGEKFQVVYGIHTDTRHIHIHFDKINKDYEYYNGGQSIGKYLYSLKNNSHNLCDFED